MKRNLGLLFLLGWMAGCGTHGEDSISSNPPVRLRELLIIPNFAANTVTIKSVNLEDGTSSVLGNPVPSAGTHPLIARSHPNVKVFYVVNRDSNVITQFTLDENGNARLISSIACPNQTQLFVVHPSGGWAYAGGGTSLRTYAISSSGVLSVQGADATLAGEPGWDADFSRNGTALHVPELGQLQSFPVAAGVLGTPITTPLASNADRAVDLDLRPGGTSIAVAVQGNDSIRAYTLGNNGFPNTLTVQNLTFRPATADFADNGQYYLGENGSPSVHAFQSNPSGVLSELADSPLVLSGTGGAYFNALDLTEKLVFSTDGNANNRLDVRLRQADGRLIGSSSDTQGLNVPGQFAFMLFLTPQ